MPVWIMGSSSTEEGSNRCYLKSNLSQAILAISVCRFAASLVALRPGLSLLTRSCDRKTGQINALSFP
jgi:hypothetical protein